MFHWIANIFRAKQPVKTLKQILDEIVIARGCEIAAELLRLIEQYHRLEEEIVSIKYDILIAQTRKKKRSHFKEKLNARLNEKIGVEVKIYNLREKLGV